MNISQPFINRPVATSLLAAGLFLLGIVAYRFLPVAPVPRVDSPTVQVTTFLPGADPNGPGACKVVAGPISPTGWCTLFAPKHG